MSELRLLANVGGEETARGRAAHDAAESVGRLLALLLPARTRCLDDSRECVEWPAAFTGDRREPAFAWLPDSGVCAWWNDEASAAAAATAGLALWGAAPGIVARVHDKAFSARYSDAEGHTPRALRGCIEVLEPDELRARDAVARIADRLDRWPQAFARDATLKPRFGTSGRGRFAVRGLDDPALPGALAGLAERGGAVLEPWLQRRADHSVQLYVAPDGTLTLLGTLTQRVSDSGVYRGHSGEIDHRLRVVSGADLDDELLGPATGVAQAAHAQGFFGPCGVDSFVFEHDGREILRPIVELNARFTLGSVVVGLIRRCRHWIEHELAPAPGERWAFDFELRPDVESRPASDDRVVCLGEDEAAPQLRFRRSR